ncbi:MAG: sigma 54-interacting transcriptional regulator, partial [Planctomycetota bacterium]|nr:sigma 54-interacting transcriptional regulator [Planctomycetota bacterium]
MRVEDLDLQALLRVDPRGGRLELAGTRALLLDAVALGLLRKQLLELLGLEGARCVLTQLGFAHGWRTAGALEHALPWDSRRDWQLAGAHLHMLQGLARVEVPEHDVAAGPEPFAHALWHDSFEAEQHLAQRGRSDEPVCWTLTGFAAGYMSYVHGRDVFCREERCVARGDPVCSMVGRPREEWDAATVEELEGTYRRPALEASLAAAAKALHEVESRLARRRRLLGAEAPDVDACGLVARSAAMRRVIDVARRVALVDTTVLVTGESGVGKERVARLIHDASSRARRPFVAVNCGALDETLLGSELFGHAKGAFTGATRDREGLFEAAHGGTIFLDEIGEVSPAMQVKLLRVLQEREVRRIGETRARRVDVRVISATNRDLAADVASGRFREDLLYRLRVMEIRIPPLRDRPEDVPDLAWRSLAAGAERMKVEVTGFTGAAMSRLLAHRWPGTVRELENAVEHALVLTSGRRVDEQDLPPQLLEGAPT